MEEIISQTVIKTKNQAIKLSDHSSYKIIPKIDQNTLFNSVYEHLKNGKVLGIFPEGGSHDRTDLLELKAGIAIMALGAMNKFNINVKIVPIGLNYYKAEEFRSKVIVDIGRAYEIPKNLAEMFRQDKKGATAIVMDEIKKVYSITKYKDVK